ncbi:MAG TPA: class I SAM-dependent methyltransferase [Chitinophagales bacterium]|nr:class I SAM-dependent methyltransferase [Chitinophagales bacterium]
MMTEGPAIYRNRTECHICGNRQLTDIMYFGKIPLADKLYTTLQEAQEKEITVPLTLQFCPACSLVQIKEIVDRSILFGADYPYYTAVSNQMVAHLGKSAQNIIATRKLNAQSFVVEAAGNDGTMLSFFQSTTNNLLNVEPATGPAAVAAQKGINTLNRFFDLSCANHIVAQHGQADVFLGSNVLAHVSDIHGFMEGIHTLLKDDGMAVIEAPYINSVIEGMAFDTVFHQHICYFSVTALNRLFRLHNLYLNNIEEVDIHGGSLRLFIQKKEVKGGNTETLLQREADTGITGVARYLDFKQRVEGLKQTILAELDKIKAGGKNIIGYGAAGKANTFLSYTGICAQYLDCIADKSPHKAGRYFSGCHLKIISPEVLKANPPAYIFILAWNFAGEIKTELQWFKDSGGRFIVALPYYNLT